MACGLLGHYVRVKDCRIIVIRRGSEVYFLDFLGFWKGMIGSHRVIV